MSTFICTRCIRTKIVSDSSRSAMVSSPATRSFSSATPTSFPRMRKDFPKRDGNKMRGVSAIRGTGLRSRQKLSVRIEDLAIPVAPQDRAPVEVDPDHGLWEFFGKARRRIMTPEELSAHGRAWTKLELERKSWYDLHALWWQCVKERNRLETDNLERERLKAGYGEYEAQARLDEVKVTMKNIRWVLTERWYAHEDARELAFTDPEVNITESEATFEPNAYDTDGQYEPLDESEQTTRTDAATQESVAKDQAHNYVPDQKDAGIAVGPKDSPKAPY